MLVSTVCSLSAINSMKMYIIKEKIMYIIEEKIMCIIEEKIQYAFSVDLLFCDTGQVEIFS